VGLGRQSRFGGFGVRGRRMGQVAPPNDWGYVNWTASEAHDTTLTSYEVRVWTSPGEELAGSENVGKPQKYPNGDCSADMSTLFGTLAPGNYTVSVAAIDPGGTTDSEKSSAFSLPLA
jgi:hypothetical protein